MTAEHNHLPAEGEIRIGVYVCHCGSNIAGVVDVAEVADGRPRTCATRAWSSLATTSSCAPASARS